MSPVAVARSPAAATPAAPGGSTVAGGYRHPSPSVEIVAVALREMGRDPSAPVDAPTSYELCRRLNAAHGRTYYYATRFLPAPKRRHVHALYGFARYADDLVDHLELDWTPAQRRAALEAWSEEFLAALEAGVTDDAVLVAVLATVAELGISHDDLRAFLHSMAMDLTVTRYATYEDLSVYVHGSAAVIGSMMLPVLGLAPGARYAEARARAMDLGVAFQLTNFLRDIAEDAARGRVYLPLEDLERFGVDAEVLSRGRVTPELRRLLAFEVARTRALYRRAEAGQALLAPASRVCIGIAHRLYGGILDAIEAADYDVFSVRARVPRRRRLALTLGELSRGSRR